MKNKHVHQYELITTRATGNRFFKCMLPECPHFLSVLELAIGRKSLCHGCRTEIVLTREHLDLKRPRCESCREKREANRQSLIAMGKSLGVEDVDGED